MIGVVHRSVSAGAVDIFSLGPLWAGLVLRGIWMATNGAFTTAYDFSMALCKSPCVTLADVQSGRSLVISSDLPVLALGMPAIHAGVGGNNVLFFEIPVYVPVHEGSLWVGIAFAPVGVVYVAAGLRVEPERVVRPALERGPAARVPTYRRAVMDELRASAEAARA